MSVRVSVSVVFRGLVSFPNPTDPPSLDAPAAAPCDSNYPPVFATVVNATNQISARSIVPKDPHYLKLTGGEAGQKSWR